MDTVFPHEHAPEFVGASTHDDSRRGDSSRTKPLQIAGFFRRLAAFLIDTAIIAIPLLVIGFLFRDIAFQLGPWGRLVGFTLVLLYRTIFDSVIGKGRTLGKWLMDIVVVDAAGQYLSVPRAFMRALLLGVIFLLNNWSHPMMQNKFLAAFTSVIIFGGLLGLLYGLIFNRTTRQGLHDLFVGSYVTMRFKNQKTNRVPWAAPLIPALHKWITYGTVVVGLAIAGWGLWAAPNVANLATLVGIEPDEWAEMEEIQQQLTETGDYFTVSVRRNTQRNLNSDTSVITLHITLWAKQSCLDNQDRCAAIVDEVAEQVVAEYGTLDRVDMVQIVVANRFDLGLANGNITYQTTDSVERWQAKFTSALQG